MRAQCALLAAPRSSLDNRPAAQSEEDRDPMRLMDAIYLIDPCIGTRRRVKVPERDHGRKIDRKRLRRLRREMGLETSECGPRHTSPPDDGRRRPSLDPCGARATATSPSGAFVNQPRVRLTTTITRTPGPRRHRLI